MLIVIACSPTAEKFDPDRLQVGLMFHLNQDLVPYAVAADDVAYTRLISTLLEYPDVPVQIHVSGTLLHMLIWTESPTLELLQNGVASGQFELLSSTYSQNIIGATVDPVLNQYQIELHRDLTAHVFDKEPSVFWNAERVWTTDVAETIASFGSFSVPVESHILFKSGLDTTDRRTWNYETTAGNLNIIHDDARFRAVVNNVFNTGDMEPFIAYLESANHNNTNRDFLITYYEDAEAAGLWQYEGGDVHPDSTMNNLRLILDFLSETDWVQPTTPSRFFAGVEPESFPGEIVRGEAKWMLEFTEGLGYANWFEYLSQDTIKQKLLNVFDELKPEVQREHALYKDMNANQPERRLFDHAMFHYAAWSYELGASWIWSGNDAGFHLARNIRFPLYAAAQVRKNGNFIERVDVNKDGVREWVIRHDDDLMIIQADEARLLYWFDLSDGSVFFDNNLTYYYAEEWEPGSRRLPMLEAGKGVYTWLYGNPLIPSTLDKVYNLRSSGPDLITESGEPARYASTHKSENSIQWAGFFDGMIITKSLLVDDGFTFRWEIENPGSSPVEKTIVIEKVFAPEPFALLTHGPGILQKQNAAWVNRVSNTTIEYNIRPEPENPSVETVFFGKMARYPIPFRLEAGEKKLVTLQLKNR